MNEKEITKESLLSIMMDCYFVPSGTPLHVQMLNFQRKKRRFGVVVDEYGVIQGVVTLEDILEEIVGDFTTTMTPATSDEVNIQPDGSYLVDGTATIRDINKEMTWNFPTDGPKTLNGLILEYLEDIPEANLSVRISGYPVEIIDVKDNMIKTVRILPDFYDGETPEE